MIDALVPLVEVAALGGIAIALLIRRVPSEDRQYLAYLVVIALVLRLAVATLFATVPSTRLFHEDANGYEGTAMLVAAGWSHAAPPISLDEAGTIAQGKYPGFLALCSVLYYVFGRYRLVVTAFTSLLGSLSVVLLYRLTAKIFHRVVARRAALLAALFPSMILWSAMALKDPVMIFLLLVALNCAAALRERLRIDALVTLVFVLFAAWLVRFYIVYFILFSLVASLLIVSGRGKLGIFSTRVVVAVVMFGLLSVFGMTKDFEAGLDRIDLQSAATFRAGMVVTAHSGFGEDADISTASGAAAFLPLGLAVLLLGPFPWQMTSLRPLLTLPEMLIWWSLIPAVWRGIRFALRREFSLTAPLVVFIATLCVAYALTLGNVGAAFRQRSQVLIFLFIFASAGKYVALCQRRGIDPDILRTRHATARASA